MKYLLLIALFAACYSPVKSSSCDDYLDKQRIQYVTMDMESDLLFVTVRYDKRRREDIIVGRNHKTHIVRIDRIQLSCRGIVI